MNDPNNIAAAIAAVVAALVALIAATSEDEHPVSPALSAPFATVEAAPVEYIGPAAAKILFLYPEGVESLCLGAGVGPVPPGRTVVACAQDDVIVMPDPCLYRDDSYAKLLCHEKAHILGWAHG